MSRKGIPNGKAMAYITIQLVRWFGKSETQGSSTINPYPPAILLEIIKSEGKLWVSTGTKPVRVVIFWRVIDYVNLSLSTNLSFYLMNGDKSFFTV
jgi:hypothetical protein